MIIYFIDNVLFILIIFLKAKVIPINDSIVKHAILNHEVVLTADEVGKKLKIVKIKHKKKRIFNSIGAFKTFILIVLVENLLLLIYETA